MSGMLLHYSREWMQWVSHSNKDLGIWIYDSAKPPRNPEEWQVLANKERVWVPKEKEEDEPDVFNGAYAAKVPLRSLKGWAPGSSIQRESMGPFESASSLYRFTQAHTNDGDENTLRVKMALYLLLEALTKPMDLPLKWALGYPEWTIKLGEAKIVSRARGQPYNPENPAMQPHAIIDAKSELLIDNDPGPVLREMGIEMLCWIYSCESTMQHRDHIGKLESRYVMISQHCREIYIISAELRHEYMRFLNGNPNDDDDINDQFLRLHLHGPFDISIRDDMEFFGINAIALTIFLAKLPLLS
ncbi:hypothetical protein N7540_001535 [Penicillium herquei]|nr:hypothetical protein N7540_001535 [Penicillium herquei]